MLSMRKDQRRPPLCIAPYLPVANLSGSSFLGKEIIIYNAAVTKKIEQVVCEIAFQRRPVRT